MKKQLAMFLVMMVVATNAWAGAWRPKDDAKVQRVNACLNKASQAATTTNAEGKATSVDDKKLLQGYCACYTAENDTNLMAYYCK